MQKSFLRSCKIRLLEGLLICIALTVGYLVAEMGYRAYLWYHYVLKTEYQIALRSTPLPGWDPYENMGWEPLNTATRIRLFNVEDDLYSDHIVKGNNFGWTSYNDYTLEKPKSEFRIAIVGSSFAACVTNSLPWPDVVESYLNKDKLLLKKLGVEHISVLNISKAGTGIEGLIYHLLPVALQFSPDLVMMNLVAGFIPTRDSPLDEHKRASTVLSNPKKQPPGPRFVLEIDGIKIPLLCRHGNPEELSDPACEIHPVWYDPKNADWDKEKVNNIKRKAAQKILGCRVVLSPFPLLLLKLLDHPLIKNFAAVPPPPASPKDQISSPKSNSQLPQNLLPSEYQEDTHRIVSGLLNIQNLHPHIVCTHNILLGDLLDYNNTQWRDFFIEMTQDVHLPLVNIGDYLPIEKGEAEWKKWYIPDGHLSDAGALVYGEGIAKMIRAYLLKNVVGEGTEPLSSEVCNESLLEFARGRALQEKGDLAQALRMFSNAIDLYHKKTALLQDSPSFKCYFLPDLYQHRAALFEKLGQPQKALKDYDAALQINPNHELSKQAREALAKKITIEQKK